MKIIQLIIGMLLFQTLNLFGDVKFQFVYVDRPGTGFHIRPKAKAALEEVGRLIGSDWLKHHDAEIFMKVSSYEDVSTDSLASAFSDLSDENIDSEFLRSFLEIKIIDQKDFNVMFDAFVKVNFHHPYSFGDQIESNQHDFKATLIHEITHALGFTSNNCKCPESFLDDFLDELFIYGINSIEGKADSRKLNKLVKKLDLLKSTKAEIDEYILKQAHSPLEVLKMGLILEFKHTLENKLPLTVQSELYKQFSDLLAQKGMTIQEFIKFYNSESNMTWYRDMLLGFQKLLTNTSELHDEKKLRSTLIIKDLLNDGFNDWVTQVYNGLRKKSAGSEDLLKCLEEIILFYAQYLMTGILDVKEFARIKSLINLTLDPLGISVKTIALSSKRPKLEPNEIVIAKDYTYFDQFVTKKDGKKFFKGNVKDKTIKFCLLKDINGEKLYFNGPNTLKYIGSAIPLNGFDASHISTEKVSIMNPGILGGPKSREWDALVTAIMLDLGYNVDNYWTRLWGHNAHETKKSPAKLEKEEI